MKKKITVTADTLKIEENIFGHTGQKININNNQRWRANTRKSKMKDEVKNAITEYRNAIRTIKAAPALYIRKCLRNDLNVLFFNNGNEFIMGVDSHYRIQVNAEMGNVGTKKDVIEKLKLSLQHCIDYK